MATSDRDGDALAEERDEDPAGGAAPRRLVRYPDHAPLGGVSEGLGLYLGVDPVVFRIAFVALALFAFPLGVLLYVVCWIAVPAAEDGHRAAPRGDAVSQQRTRTWLGVTLLIIGGVWLLSQLAALPVAGLLGFELLGGALTSGAVLALLLIGGGVALLVLERQGTDATPEAGARPSAAPEARERPGTVAGAGERSSAAPASPAYPAVPAPSTEPSSAAPQPSAQRSRLGRLTAGAALVVLGVAWLLDQLGAVDVGVRQLVALALIVVGGGLVVGGWWGRSRGLIGWGVALAVLLAVTTLAQVGLQDARALAAGGVGERQWEPTTVEQIQPAYELGVGEATLDLSEVDFGGEDVDVDARLGMGQLTVVVPEDVDVTVDGSFRLGEMSLFGTTTGGVGGTRRTVTDRVDDADGELDLTAAVGMGELVVDRR